MGTVEANAVTNTVLETSHATPDRDYSPPDHTAAYLNNSKLFYPAATRERGVEGVVVLKVLVSAEGHPLIMKIEQSSGHPMLDTAALWSMEEWRFEPARRHGHAVEALVEIPIHFRRTESAG